MNTEQYVDLRQNLIDDGYADEIDWAENIQAPENATDFACEYVFVVLNSGMKNQVAQGIWERVRPALFDGRSATEVFGHPGKARAIDEVWENRETHFRAFQESSDVLAFCKSLPWIGEITKFHLSKNLGLDVAKPDRHLERIAATSGETTESVCERLAKATGDRVATVDLVIWRAANLGKVRVENNVLVFA